MGGILENLNPLKFIAGNSANLEYLTKKNANQVRQEITPYTPPPVPPSRRQPNIPAHPSPTPRNDEMLVRWADKILPDIIFKRRSSPDEPMSSPIDKNHTTPDVSQNASPQTFTGYSAPPAPQYVPVSPQTHQSQRSTVDFNSIIAQDEAELRAKATQAPPGKNSGSGVPLFPWLPSDHPVNQQHAPLSPKNIQIEQPQTAQSVRPPITKELLVGQTVSGTLSLDKYSIKDFIGEGGYSFVYLAEPLQPSPDQPAITVVKLFKESADPNLLTEFKNEARRMAQLKHAHIVPIYDTGVGKVIYRPRGALQEEIILPYIFMGYAPEGSLRRFKPEDSAIHFSPGWTVSLITQAADALQYAHDMDIIHLDVKPENLLMKSPTEIWLSDFGLARRTGTSVQNDALIGTPKYMSPEQIRKLPERATDQYALAVVTYELLTGGVPFDSSNKSITEKDRQILKGHLILTPPSFSEQLGNQMTRVVGELEGPVLKALSKEPSKRYSSVAAFADDLKETYHTKAVVYENRRPTYHPRP